MAEDNKTQRAPDAQDKFESSKTHARKAAEDLRSAAGKVAEEYANDQREILKQLRKRRN